MPRPLGCDKDVAPVIDRKPAKWNRRVLRWLVPAVVLCAAAGFGSAVGLMEDTDLRRLILEGDGPHLLKRDPNDLRRLMVEQREQVLASGELAGAAALNGVLAQEAILRVRAVHNAWMPRRDPGTKLFPESLRRPRWNYRNTAADFFCFLFHAGLYTDEPSVPLLRETLRAEAALVGPGQLCQPVASATGRPIRSSASELMFGASEYAKDGLLSLYEATGDAQVYQRLLEVVDAVIAHSEHRSRFGPIPGIRSEVNGEMLQVLSRLALVEESPVYGEMAARIGDAAIQQMLAANHGLPAHKYDYEDDRVIEERVRIRDHGSEVIGGLSEVYALAVSRRADPQWAARAERWAEPLARMYELLLEYGINEAGLIVNALDPSSRRQIDAGANDNWGYILSGLLLYTQAAGRHGVIDAARLESLLRRADEVVSAVVSTDGLAWEGPNQDGYADALESALYIAAHRPGCADALLPWVDRQIGIMFDMQQESGFVDGHYLDGNFIRTTLMYADLRSGGWRIDPWDAGTRVGMARREGQAVLVVESRDGYEGVLRPRRAAHELRRNLPWNWPRLNSWPEWLAPSTLRTVRRAEGIATVPSVEELTKGVRVAVPRGGRLVLWLDVADAGDEDASRAVAVDAAF
jgi:hypothetical protein